ncbi:MAG: helix-turn-helix domain-containing protein [Thermoanaerobaculaceae bacterium]|jgi:hypothetical protein|nr:helix-turn-helix domain-containing protein [Thermoanaerobaculaceae bacterium]
MTLLTDTVRRVRNEADLATFRSTVLTEETANAVLQASGGRVLNNLPLGVGKSLWARTLIEGHLRNPRVDLIVCLAAQWRVLEEQPLVREVQRLGLRARREHDVAVLHGRLPARCGDLDTELHSYEVAGCGSLGRAVVCPQCRHYQRCPWPRQFTRAMLKGKRVIFGVQAYLERLPQFMTQLKWATKAKQILAILDEPAVVDAPMRGHVSYEELEAFRAVVEKLHDGDPHGVLHGWLAVLDRLRDPRARLDGAKLEWLDEEMVLDLQQQGLAMFGDRFRYLGHELRVMLRGRRWRDLNGYGITYHRRPFLRSVDYILIAADLPIEVARHRLGEPGLQELYPGVQVLHEGTQIYNLRSSIGAATYFHTHAKQISYAVAQLVAKYQAEGKRTLLVVKKRLARKAAALLEHDLRELTRQRFRVRINPRGPADIARPLTVPLITFGVVGVNLYEGFDVAIAVSSYNASPDVLADLMNELHAPGEEVRTELVARAGRRVATVVGYAHRGQAFDQLARAYQHHIEAGVVTQAMARVRYTIHPRTVIFMQGADLGLPLTAEFTSLEGLRQHFGLMSRRESEVRRGHEQVAAMVQAGMTRGQIAVALGISKRTVYRRLGVTRSIENTPIHSVSPGADRLSPSEEGNV